MRAWERARMEDVSLQTLTSATDTPFDKAPKVAATVAGFDKLTVNCTGVGWAARVAAAANRIAGKEIVFMPGCYSPGIGKLAPIFTNSLITEQKEIVF